MIFNKSNDGSTELYNLTGTFYAANDYRGISEDIALSENEIMRLIGKTVFDRAESHYRSENYHNSLGSINTDDTLVRRIQSPVAYKAMLNYYQRNFVSHEDSGRKVKISEGEKLPWAWQIEKDDAVMRDTYFRTLDELYRFLEENEIAEWKASPQRQLQQQSIIRNIGQFESVYPLDGSFYTFYILMPFILEVQQRFVQPIVGDKYSEILSNITPQLTTAAQRFIALKAMIIAVQRLSITVFPIGIAQRFSDSFQGTTGNNIPSQDALRFYLASLDKQAAEALQELHKALSIPGSNTNYPLIPENDPNNKFFTI